MATALLKGCLPYFVIKRDQAEVIMQYDTLGYHRSGQGIRLDPNLVKERDELKFKLHEMKKRGRFDEFKSNDKQEVVRYG